MDADTDEFLAHFGVKGMRWGVSRSRGSDGRVHGTGTGTPRAKEYSTDAAKTLSINEKKKTSGITSLSNEELQTAITRMNLEQNYSRLSPTQVSKGQKFVKGAGVGTGKFVGNVAKDLGRQYLMQLVKTGIDAKLKK